MKKLIFSCLLTVLFFTATNAQYGTQRSGYEGDYFSLEGALDLFKQSNSIRDFERKINTQNNWVNNLDLDYDGRTDYIRVEHKRRGNLHAIILQTPISRYDIQDIAVIEIEIIGRREAVLQIVGDEDLYGEEVVVEPIEGYSDSRGSYNQDYGDYVNVYYWKPVQYILGQQYRAYVSPYRWQYYPTWWSPWRQCAWDVFRPRIVIYHQHYHIVRRHRVVRVHNFYRPYRSYSHPVTQRANEVRVRHGKKAIHRPAPRTNRTRIEDQSGNRRIEGRSGNTSRNANADRRPSASRNRSVTTPNQKATRNTTTPQQTRTRTTTAPTRRPSASRNRSAGAPSQKATRNTTQQTRTRTTTAPTRRPSVSRSRSASAPSQKATRNATQQTRTRSTAPTRRSSASSGRTTSSAKQKASRSNSSRSRKGGGF